MLGCCPVVLYPWGDYARQSLCPVADVTIPTKPQDRGPVASLVPHQVPIAGVCSCVDTRLVSRVDTCVVSRLGTYVDSLSNLVPLDARLNIVPLDARLRLVRLGALSGLDVGAFFDGNHLVLGGAESHLPDESGGAELPAAVSRIQESSSEKIGTAGPPEPGHDMASGGLHVVDHLLEDLLLVVVELPVVLDDDRLRQHGVLYLAAKLRLQLEVHNLVLKVEC